MSLFIDKYKPVLLEDFDLEENLYNIVNTMIRINNLNIMFVGGTGCGKTALMNAVIREYYKDVKDDKLIEDSLLCINNLREQGINYYRNEVKTFCQTCSLVKGKKKIIILDDIDVINEQSQQVFRNYIDKYSNNVHFISSCYNIQKVIENLQSRFIIIKIPPFNKIRKLINSIKTAECIVIEPEAEEFLVNICNNTAKVVINYMEKFKLLDLPITLDLAIETCTNINFACFEEYTTSLKTGNLPKAINIIYSIYDKGYSVMDILDSYFIFVKFTNILTETEKYEYIPIICKYITIFHTTHEDEIELSLFTNNLSQIVCP